MTEPEPAKMPKFQHEYCEKMINKILKMEISYPFRRQITSDINSNRPLYESVKKPMDLSMVQKKLAENQYESIIEWGLDVRHIWFNAKTAYKDSEPYYLMAADISKWFEDRWTNYPRYPNEQWMVKLQKVQKAIRNLVNISPLRKDLLPIQAKPPAQPKPAK